MARSFCDVTVTTAHNIAACIYAVSLQKVHQARLATDWMSLLREKKAFFSNILFFAAPDAILQIFSVVKENSILPLNQKKTTSIGNSFEQLYLGL